MRLTDRKGAAALKATEPKKQRTTLQEQKQAKAGLEAFRRWTEDNTEG